jgi:acetylornithine deacetylase/succinyl-diaminopimelate desuccinylase-like protein
MSDQTDAVLDRIDREKEDYLDELQEYLRIPSISTDPQYADDVRRAADFLAGKLETAGLDTEILETDGYPLVYAEWMGAPGQPTVLFYGHYDVQPADPLELWRNPPFEPQVEDGFLVARGSTDDKGQSYTHAKAVAAILAERGTLPVNVKFLVEGEEESGGEAIENYVRQDRGQKLAADCVVVSDTSMFAPGQPSLLYGLKGMAYMEVRVHGPDKDLHSGTFGGTVMNPANALAHIIDTLRDVETGEIQIDGFYDKVLPLEDWERQEWAKLPYDESEYAASVGVPETFGEAGYSTRERGWGRPTCDVNGIFGGYAGEGAKTIIPSWAGAKVSMRLVPDQDPKEIARLFTEHVKRVAPPSVRVEVIDHHGAVPSRFDASGPIADAAMDALEEVFGKRPVRVREGGSIPIVATFADVLDCPVLLMGFGLPDDGLHSPNERFSIANFYDGIRSVAVFLDRLGASSDAGEASA